MLDLTKHREQSLNKAKENKLFLQRLGKRLPKNLNEVTYALHNSAVERIDCLECANCCKSISPIVMDRDLDKMAKYLRIKAADLLEQYLMLDKDGDYVFRSQPCPFLMDDNKCRIYDARPKACKTYPHTDHERVSQVLEISYHNSLVCPIAFDVVEGLKREFKGDVAKGLKF